MFEKEYCFRYSDLDNKGRIRPTAVLDILQDISTAHSTAAGYSLDRIYSTGVAMVLKGWRIEFIKDFDFNHAIIVNTGIMSVSKFEGIRKYEILQDGICKVKATGVWFAVDFFAGKIIPVPEEMQKAYECIEEEDNALPFVKVKGIADAPLLGTSRTEKRDIDTNNHMNNVKSVEVALEYLPENYKISELMITYRKSFHEGDMIRIFGVNTSNEHTIMLKNQNDENCVTVMTK